MLTNVKSKIMDKLSYVKDWVLDFFNNKYSNIVGIGLGGALTALSLIDFSVVGLAAGVFLLVAEGIQYWERAN